MYMGVTQSVVVAAALDFRPSEPTATAASASAPIPSASSSSRKGHAYIAIARRF